MRITVREASLIENVNDQSKRVITERKAAEYTPGSFFVEGGELEDQIFKQYYAGDSTRDQALQQLTELVSSGKFESTQAQPMINTEFKIAFYN